MSTEDSNDIERQKRIEFLTKLADLCEAYRASFSYSHDDDGIQIYVDGSEVFSGFDICDPKYAPKALRDAAYIPKLDHKDCKP